MYIRAGLLLLLPWCQAFTFLVRRRDGWRADALDLLRHDNRRIYRLPPIGGLSVVTSSSSRQSNKNNSNDIPAPDDAVAVPDASGAGTTITTTTATSTLRTTASFATTPNGRVQDIPRWLQLSSDSLKHHTGKTILDEMTIISTEEDAGGSSSSSSSSSWWDQVHTSQRYAVLSHGVQQDPVYNYMNCAALLQFEWPEEEVYTLPSRYSAPEGPVRTSRESLMQSVVEQEVKRIPTAVRTTKSGRNFQLVDVILWNVYSEDGTRVGQTALFDRSKIVDL